MQRIFHIYFPADWFRVGENLFVEKERKGRDGWKIREKERIENQK